MGNYRNPACAMADGIDKAFAVLIIFSKKYANSGYAMAGKLYLAKV